MSQIIIRKERPDEARQVEELVRDAFWDKYMPGCSEHLLAHKLRESSIFMPDLSRVAEADGRLVGMIYYVSGVVKTEQGQVQILSFGPLSVLPDYQGRGIGARLINETVQMARMLDYPAIVIYGHYDYYKRFGFEKGEKYGLTGPDGLCDALLVLTLDKDLKRLDGCLVDDPIYNLSPDEVRAFDSTFPKRQKHKLPSQIFDGPLD